MHTYSFAGLSNNFKLTADVVQSECNIDPKPIKKLRRFKANWSSLVRLGGNL